MATVFILAGSFVGFMLGSVSFVFGAGITMAMVLWMAVGLGSACLAAALALTKPQSELDGQTQTC